MKERRCHERLSPKEHFTVFDRSTDMPIGVLVNLSDKGAMFATPGPIKESTQFECRVDLAHTVMEHDAVLFEAECQWSRNNIKAKQWESGFRLKVTGVDAELIQYLILSFRVHGRGADEIPDVKTIEIDNRRESTRYEFDKTLAVFDEHSYRLIGELADLSTQGLRMITSKPIKKGGELHCRVRLPKEVFRHDYLILKTECMWSTRTSDGMAHESGHWIVNIEPPHEAILVYLLIHYGKPRTAKRQKKVVG